jgi:mediator of RNA polymerase II transcription subunit 14
MPNPAPKHWILIGVDSEEAHTSPDSPANSAIVLKWYRDGVQVRDVDITVDSGHLSVENIIKTVVGMHIHHIQSTLYSKFAAHRFGGTSARPLVLSPPETNPEDMVFSIPVGTDKAVALKIDPTSGEIHIRPKSQMLHSEERRLNASRNPTDDGVQFLEQARWRVLADILVRKATCCEWLYNPRPPMPGSAIKSQVRVQLPFYPLFFQRRGWRPDWYIMIHLSIAGDSCWAIQWSNGQGQFARLPIDIAQADSDAAFWSSLDVLATGVMTQNNIRSFLLQRGVHTKSDESLVETVPGLPSSIPIPVVLAKLSDVVPFLMPKMGSEMQFSDKATGIQGQFMDVTSDPNKLRLPQLDLIAPASRSRRGTLGGRAMAKGPSSSQPKAQNMSWVYDMVKVAFKGFSTQSGAGSGATYNNNKSPSLCVSKVSIRALDPDFFKFLNGKSLGGDVVFSLETGEFVVSICHDMGIDIGDLIVARVNAIDRLVDFVEAMNHVPPGIRYTSIKLDEVKFTYPDTRNLTRWPVQYDLSGPSIRVNLDAKDPHLPAESLISRIANGGNGISAVMKWLPITLDLFAAINIILAIWEDPEKTHIPPYNPATQQAALPLPTPPQQTPRLKSKKLSKQQQQAQQQQMQQMQQPPPQRSRICNVRANPTSLEWLTLQYFVIMPSGLRGDVLLHIRIFYDEPSPWWCIDCTTATIEFPDAVSTTRVLDAADLEFFDMIRRICDENNLPFKTMSNTPAASTRSAKSTAETLIKLDERVRELMATSTAVDMPSAAAPSSSSTPVVMVE